MITLSESTPLGYLRNAVLFWPCQENLEDIFTNTLWIYYTVRLNILLALLVQIYIYSKQKFPLTLRGFQCSMESFTCIRKLHTIHIRLGKYINHQNNEKLPRPSCINARLQVLLLAFKRNCKLKVSKYLHINNKNQSMVL